MFAIIVLTLMVIFSVMAVETKDLIYASIYLGAVSVFASIVFVILSAPDIALTEAAICAGLSTFIFISAVKKTKRMENE